jgi:hypothetical protein
MQTDSSTIIFPPPPVAGLGLSSTLGLLDIPNDTLITGVNINMQQKDPPKGHSPSVLPLHEITTPPTDLSNGTVEGRNELNRYVSKNLIREVPGRRRSMRLGGFSPLRKTLGNDGRLLAVSNQRGGRRPKGNLAALFKGQTAPTPL